MPETKPRYTVELTTEGWQIRDHNVRDDNEKRYLADQFGSKTIAQYEAHKLNRLSE